MPEKTYLDANGNPAGSAPPVYLDPNTGEPIAGHPPEDPRNGVQRFVDKLTTVTPEQEASARNVSVNPAVGEILNQAQKFGAGAIQGATQPFVHPLDTLSGIGHLLTTNPLTTGKQMLQGAVSNPAQTAGNLVGGAVLGNAAGEAAAPAVQVLKKGAGRAVLLGNTPEGAYESALKPSTLIPEAQRARVVQAGLDNAIPVSKAGVEKLSDLVDDYNKKISGEIANDPNRPIDPNAVATRADQAKARFANQVNAQGDLNAIEASKQQFLAEQGATPGQPAPMMAAAKAQAMKQGTYSVLRGKFGEQGSASVEAQKALARGLKEEIATQFPEISNLNAAESKLLDLQPILERAVNRIGNHQLIGIGTPIAGAATKAVTGSGSLGVVVGTIKAVLDNPVVKSRLAIAVSKGAKIPIAQASARVQAYSSALGSAVAGSQAYSSGASPTQSEQPQP